MTKTKKDYFAKLTVHGLPLGKVNLKRLISWLKILSKDIEKQPEDYSSTFTAKLMK